MNIVLTILAAADKVMTLFIPIALATLLIMVTDIPSTGWNGIILLLIASASTLFRGIKEVLKAYE